MWSTSHDPVTDHRNTDRLASIRAAPRPNRWPQFFPQAQEHSIVAIVLNTQLIQLFASFLRCLGVFTNAPPDLQFLFVIIFQIARKFQNNLIWFLAIYSNDLVHETTNLIKTNVDRWVRDPSETFHFTVSSATRPGNDLVGHCFTVVGQGVWCLTGAFVTMVPSAAATASL